jgi:thiamine-monophosphate kinase
MLALADAHRIAVIGGNISRSPGPLMVDVTATGTVRRRRILTRAGARPGDGVYVTGAIGDALVGLRSLQRGGSERMAEQERRYLRPEPRVRTGLVLAGNRAASACMDLSDGLADAARQIAEASHVGITLDAALLPIRDAVRGWHENEGRDPVMGALESGEDYELLFTVRRAHEGRLRAVRRAIGDVPITRIGVVTKDSRISIRTAGEERPLPEGFQHFR